MADLVNYGGYDVEDLDKDSAIADAISGNIFKEWDQGDNIVRFVPPRVGEKALRFTAMHYIKDVPGVDGTMTFACPRVELKEPCVVCEMAERLAKSRSSVDRQRAKDMGASLRIYANLIDREAPPAAALKIGGFGKMVHRGLKMIRKNPRLGGDWTNPSEGGFDVIITREGTGMTTKYTVNADRNPSPLAASVEEMNHIITTQANLDTIVKSEIPEVLLRVFQSSGVSYSGPTTQSATNTHKVGANLVQTAPASVSVVDTAGVEVEYDEDFNVVKRGLS